MKVLIIDDDQSIVEVWSIILKEQGYEVIRAYNGAEGIRAAITEKPDLVLTDQIMPDIAGNEVIKILKSDPTTQAIPIAVMSNYNDTQSIEEAKNLGAIDYILKYQLQAEQLPSLVEKLLGHQPVNSH